MSELTFDGPGKPEADPEPEESYQDETDEPGDGEPEEDDLVTEDYERWFQYGKLVLTVPEGGPWAHRLSAFMKQEKFWPNVYWVSDHGNAHPIDMLDALAKEDEEAGDD